MDAETKKRAVELYREMRRMRVDWGFSYMRAAKSAWAEARMRAIRESHGEWR